MHLLSLTTQFQHKSQLEMKFSCVEESLEAVLPHKTTLQGVFFSPSCYPLVKQWCIDASAALDETPFFFFLSCCSSLSLFYLWKKNPETIQPSLSDSSFYQLSSRAAHFKAQFLKTRCNYSPLARAILSTYYFS